MNDPLSPYVATRPSVSTSDKVSLIYKLIYVAEKDDAINVMQVAEVHIHLITYDIAMLEKSNENQIFKQLNFLHFLYNHIVLPRDGPVVLQVCSEHFALLFAISRWIVV